MGEDRGLYRVLVGKPEGRRPLGRPTSWISKGRRPLGRPTSWISRRWNVGIWTGLGWSRVETGGGRL